MARRIAYRKSLELSLQARLLRTLLALLPPEETEAIAIAQQELEKLTAELHKMWGIS